MLLHKGAQIADVPFSTNRLHRSQTPQSVQLAKSSVFCRITTLSVSLLRPTFYS